MAFLVGFVCFLMISYADAKRRVFFSDDLNYNPCQAGSDVYFYAHPSDPHLYYQCDESGNAYQRSCNNLVWDDMSKACNWPTAIIKTTTTTEPTTFFTTATPMTTKEIIPSTFIPSSPSVSFRPSITPALTSPPTAFPTIPMSTVAPSLSLCQSQKLCGDHGQCFESPSSVPLRSRTFICICDEDWFGQFCEKRITDLERIRTPVFDQVATNVTATATTPSLTTLTMTSMNIIKTYPDILIAGYSGVPNEIQNRFEGDQRKPLPKTHTKTLRKPRRKSQRKNRRLSSRRLSEG